MSVVVMGPCCAVLRSGTQAPLDGGTASTTSANLPGRRMVP